MDRHPFLTVLGAEIVAAGVVVVAWNVVQRFRDNGITLRGALRI